MRSELAHAWIVRLPRQSLRTVVMHELRPMGLAGVGQARGCDAGTMKIIDERRDTRVLFDDHRIVQSRDLFGRIKPAERSAHRLDKLLGRKFPEHVQLAQLTAR